MARRARDLPDEVTLDIGLDDPDDAASLRPLVARKLRCAPAALPDLVLRKRSVDARRGRVRFHLVVGLTDDPDAPIGGEPLREPSTRDRVVIVGDGPAGLFCAYQLAREGVRCVVVDRGKPVQPRRHDLKGLNRRGRVDEDSNYCFGEGGAGTYSDGKLYTRSHKRGNVRDVIEVLTAHGAPPAILTDARPHIGSNKLPKVVTALREALEAVGVTFRFGARVTRLKTEGTGAARRAAGVILADGTELDGAAVVLATGHSARDVFRLLGDLGLPLEAKSFALGVRIEHPQPLINEIQYGAAAGHPKLPAAPYRLAREIDGRGVFSFCMCPGGWVVPASTAPGGLVVNGMSLSRRDSPFANSGLVVGVSAEDLSRAGFDGPLGGIALQQAVEAAAWEAGGGDLRAPATRVPDFLAGKGSARVPDSSYLPGLVASDIGPVLAVSRLPIVERLQAALKVFDQQLRGYASDEAVLIATESRTSAPVRVPRDKDTFQALGLADLYPAGEGAGYAGGIVSAAVDGIETARRVAARVRSPGAASGPRANVTHK